MLNMQQVGNIPPSYSYLLIWRFHVIHSDLSMKKFKNMWFIYHDPREKKTPWIDKAGKRENGRFRQDCKLL